MTRLEDIERRVGHWPAGGQGKGWNPLTEAHSNYCPACLIGVIRADLDRVTAALEPSPDLKDWEFEVDVANLSATGGESRPFMGTPVGPVPRVRVRRGMGDEFWAALADLYEGETRT